MARSSRLILTITSILLALGLGIGGYIFYQHQIGTGFSLPNPFASGTHHVAPPVDGITLAKPSSLSDDAISAGAAVSVTLTDNEKETTQELLSIDHIQMVSDRRGLYRNIGIEGVTVPQQERFGEEVSLSGASMRWMHDDERRGLAVSQALIDYFDLYLGDQIDLPALSGGVMYMFDPIASLIDGELSDQEFQTAFILARLSSSLAGTATILRNTSISHYIHDLATSTDTPQSIKDAIYNLYTLNPRAYWDEHNVYPQIRKDLFKKGILTDLGFTIDTDGTITVPDRICQSDTWESENCELPLPDDVTVKHTTDTDSEIITITTILHTSKQAPAGKQIITIKLTNGNVFVDMNIHSASGTIHTPIKIQLVDNTFDIVIDISEELAEWIDTLQHNAEEKMPRGTINATCDIVPRKCAMEINMALEPYNDNTVQISGAMTADAQSTTSRMTWSTASGSISADYHYTSGSDRSRSFDSTFEAFRGKGKGDQSSGKGKRVIPDPTDPKTTLARVSLSYDDGNGSFGIHTDSGNAICKKTLESKTHTLDCTVRSAEEDSEEYTGTLARSADAVTLDIMDDIRLLERSAQTQLLTIQYPAPFVGLIKLTVSTTGLPTFGIYAGNFGGITIVTKKQPRGGYEILAETDDLARYDGSLSITTTPRDAQIYTFDNPTISPLPYIPLVGRNTENDLSPQQKQLIGIAIAPVFVSMGISFTNKLVIAQSDTRDTSLRTSTVRSGSPVATQGSARDIARINSIHQIKTGLEMHHTEYDKYPASSGTSLQSATDTLRPTLKNDMIKIPTDPNGKPYLYASLKHNGEKNRGFILVTALETTNRCNSSLSVRAINNALHTNTGKNKNEIFGTTIDNITLATSNEDDTTTSSLLGNSTHRPGCTYILFNGE